jgi:hypothetical protein
MIIPDPLTSYVLLVEIDLSGHYVFTASVFVFHYHIIELSH